MVGAARVVAERLRSPGAKEDRARAGDARQQRAGLLHLENEVLRRVGVGDGGGLGEIGGQQTAAAHERPAGDGDAGEVRQLTCHLGSHRGGGARGEGDEHDLRVGTVFGLGKQVRGNEGRISPVIRDDHHLGRTGRQVDGGAVGVAGDLLLGLGDVGIARAEDLVALRDACGAVREGGDGLGATNLEDLGDAAQLRGEQDPGTDATIASRRSAQGADRAVGKLGRDA